MRGILAIASTLALVIGCVQPAIEDPPIDPPDTTPRGCAAETHTDAVFQPEGCWISQMLNGTDVFIFPPPPLGPVTVGAVNVCLHLRAIDNDVRAHFASATEPKQGDVSGFELVLTAPDGQTLAHGVEISMDGKTRAQLEFDVPAGTERDAILRVTASHPCRTAIGVELYEPFVE